jgi:hypothetical protein
MIVMGQFCINTLWDVHRICDAHTDRINSQYEKFTQLEYCKD